MNLRYLHWDIVLVQDLELWEVLLVVAPPVASHVGMEIVILRAFD